MTNRLPAGSRIVARYKTVPLVALELAPAGVLALIRDQEVGEIMEDVPVPPALAESLPLIGADRAHAAGLAGTGHTVAILDTGAATSHPFISGRDVAHACYSSNEPSHSASTLCPGGATESTAYGSGLDCSTSISGCGHGTHVTGIAAGSGSSFSGVARGANYISIQVFSRFDDPGQCSPHPAPCALTYPSDQIKGLERVYALRNTFVIGAANMSLGGGRHTSTCDREPQKLIIDNLRSAGIATVAASGNDGYSDALSSPACISSAISVGSTDDGSSGTAVDTVSTFTNSASFLDLLAPGKWINSSLADGGFGNFAGTSMAAPHVAGAWALMKQRYPDRTVAGILQLLKDTGTPVLDARNGITKPRIQVDAALGLSNDGAPANDAFSAAHELTGPSASRPNDTNVNATKETGEPNHAGNAGGSSVWYRWTAPASGQVTIDTIGSNFDTLLAAYTGTAVNGLTERASNDDINGSLQSRIAFAATAGTTYRIAVDGYNSGTGAATGTVKLNLALVSATPPTATITSGPTGLTNNASPSFAFSSSEQNSSFQCRLNSGSWAPCTSPRAYANLPDGPHTFSVRATDQAGNTGPAASRSFTVDTAAPGNPILVLRIDRLQPKRNLVRPGQVVRYRLSVRNQGDAAASNPIRVCLKRPGQRLLRVTGKRCRSVPALAAGARVARAFRVRATRRASGRKLRVRFIVRSPDAPNKSAQSRLRVR